MRGTNIEKEWYDDDKTTGSKIYIIVTPKKFPNNTELQSVYKIINRSRPGYLEYLYYVTTDTYRIVAKFKDRYKPEYRARLRKTLFEFNNSKSNSVNNITSSIQDVVQSLSNYGNVSLIRGPKFTKELNITVNRPNTLHQEFVEFLNRQKLMLFENSEMFINSEYNQIHKNAVMVMLDNDEKFHRFQPATIAKFLKYISQTDYPNLPVYRPRRRYLEYADCIYDTFEMRSLKKQTDLLESGNIVVHPCCKFDNTFIHCSQNLPDKYLIQIGKVMEPEMFMWGFNNFVGEHVPGQNCTIFSCPNMVKIFEPLIKVYRNVLHRIDNINYRTFALSDYASKDIIVTEYVDPLIQFNKNVLFKDSNMLYNLLNGTLFEVQGKYNRIYTCTPKNIISFTSDNIYYIPSHIRNNILGLQLPRSPAKIDASILTDDHIGGYIIASILTNEDMVKQYIKDARYDNNWNIPIKVNGKLWPDHDPWKTIPRPTSHHYSMGDLVDYDDLKRI